MDFYIKPVKKRVIDPLEPIPVGVAEEVDWADWEDSVGFQDSQPVEFQLTDRQPLAPSEGAFIDVFACVAPRGR